jgi:hypothetical protein
LREFDSHSVLLIFDNLVEPTKGVHGVVVTRLLAKEELRVRFSLDALQLSGCGKVWHGVVFSGRVLREQEIVGSNPTILTVLKHIPVGPVLVREGDC